MKELDKNVADCPFEPLNGNILIRQIIEEKVDNVSGIHMGNKESFTAPRGEVVAKNIGNDFLMVGDIVAYRAYDMFELVIDGEKLQVINQDSIVGKYK